MMMVRFTRYPYEADASSPRDVGSSRSHAQQSQRIEATATTDRPQLDPLDIGRAGIRVGEQQCHDVVGSGLGARGESHVDVQCDSVRLFAGLERYDGWTSVKFTGLGLALAPHDEVPRCE